MPKKPKEIRLTPPMQKAEGHSLRGVAIPMPKPLSLHIGLSVSTPYTLDMSFVLRPSSAAIQSGVRFGYLRPGGAAVLGASERVALLAYAAAARMRTKGASSIRSGYPGK